MSELFKITAFFNEFEYSVRGGVVYQVVDADQEYVDSLLTKEKAEHPSWTFKVEAQG